MPDRHYQKSDGIDAAQMCIHILKSDSFKQGLSEHRINSDLRLLKVLSLPLLDHARIRFNGAHILGVNLDEIIELHHIEQVHVSMRVNHWNVQKLDLRDSICKLVAGRGCVVFDDLKDFIKGTITERKDLNLFIVWRDLIVGIHIQDVFDDDLALLRDLGVQTKKV